MIMKDTSQYAFIICDWHEQSNSRSWITKFEDANKAYEAFKDGNYDSTIYVINKSSIEEFIELQYKLKVLEKIIDTDHIYNIDWHNIDHDSVFKEAYIALNIFNELPTYSPVKQELKSKVRFQIQNMVIESFIELSDLEDWLEI